MKCRVNGNPRALGWLLIVILANPVTAAPKQDHSQQRETQMLSLIGEIVKVEVQARGSDLIYKVRLRLELINISRATIILLRGQYPEKQQGWWMLGTRMAHTPEDLVANRVFYNSGVRPANSSTSSEWKNLRRRLDQNPPPMNETHELRSGERLPFYAETFVVVSSADQKSSNSTEYLDVTFEMWPLNIEQGSSKHEFGKKLRHEWRNRGVLWLEAVTSEPIALDLKKAKQNNF